MDVPEEKSNGLGMGEECLDRVCGRSEGENELCTTQKLYIDQYALGSFQQVLYMCNSSTASGVHCRHWHFTHTAPISRVQYTTPSLPPSPTPARP